MKHVVACAGLGIFSLAAQAQSSVTLYGVVDANVEYANNLPGATGKDSASRLSLRSGGMSTSRWGIRGVEELGGGVKAVFALENGFNVDTGSQSDSSRLFDRQAFVGLSSQYGTLTFGRQYTTMFSIMGNYVPQAYAPQYEPISTVVTARNDNAVKYVGKFGVVGLGAHYSFGERPGAFSSGAGWGLGATYAPGDFSISAAYDQLNPQAGTGSGSGRTQYAGIGANYVAGPATLFAAYRWGSKEDEAGRPITRDNFWWTGVRYELTQALALTGAFYYDDIKTSCGTSCTNPANPWQATALLDYSLSKRTNLYAVAAYAKNAAMNFGFGGYTLAQGKNSQTAMAIGIRTKF